MGRGKRDDGGRMKIEKGKRYIPNSIHSAENHRGTFRGAPARGEIREKNDSERGVKGEKARELLASTKLKQKA